MNTTRLPLAGLLAAAVGLLASCAPVVGAVVRTPQFELREAGLASFDPPGLDTPARAVIHLEVEARNPNPFGASVSEVGLDLVLDGQKVAAASTPGFSLLPAGAPSRVPLDVEVPVTGATLGSLLKIARGEAVSYRLDGSFRLEAGPLGRPKFGPYTVAQGTYRSAAVGPGPNSRPSFTWRSDLTRLTVGVGGLVLDLAFEASNPSPVGYRLIAPLALLVGDQTVARSEAGGTVPARGKGLIYTRFQIDPITAARAVIAGRFDFSVSGAPTIEVPGLQSYAFPLSLLFSGTATR